MRMDWMDDKIKRNKEHKFIAPGEHIRCIGDECIKNANMITIPFLNKHIKPPPNEKSNKSMLTTSQKESEMQNSMPSTNNEFILHESKVAVKMTYFDC